MKGRNEAIAAARSSFWLSLQPPEVQDALCNRARTLTLARGAYLFHVGDKADEFYFVADGVLITSGVHPLVGAVHGQVNHPGQWFGEPAALSQRPRLGSVLARKNSTLVAVSFTAVMEEMKTLPQIATSLFDLMANNTEEHMLHGLDLLIQNPKKRMCSRLLTLAGRRVRQPPPVSISIPISQDELALTSCMSRQTVNQALGELVSDGICALRYGEISILDTRRLADIVS